MRKIILGVLFLALPMFATSLKSIETSNLIVLLGNTGAGKSFLGNLLVPKNGPQFLSSYAASSVTAKFSALPSNWAGWKVADTPGLNDNFRPYYLIAYEIKKALTASKGQYKLCFVLATSGGRLSGDDVNTMKLIISAINQEIPYYVLVNQSKLEKKYQDEFINLLFKCLSFEREGFLKVNLPKGIFFIPMLEKSEEEETQKMVSKLGHFVEKMESVKIEKVSNILKMDDETTKVLNDYIKNPEKYKEEKPAESSSTWLTPIRLFNLGCGIIIVALIFKG